MGRWDLGSMDSGERESNLDFLPYPGGIYILVLEQSQGGAYAAQATFKVAIIQ